MKIIIAGASDVGLHLAKLLSFESQDITLIDCVKDDLNYADTHLDIRAIKGDPSALSTLKKADAGASDMMIAVTPSETTNLMCCLLAKQLGCKRTIARVTNIEFDKYKQDVDFHSLGIDELISPEELAAKEIQLLVNQSAFNNSYEFEGGALTMMGTTLQESAPFVGKSVKEAAAVFPEVHFMPIAIKRVDSTSTLIPRGDTMFEAGDQVYFISSKEGMDELYKLTGFTQTNVEDVMILGGGRIGSKTAEELCAKGVRVKLVELDKEKAISLAERLPDTLVIHGDGRNVELLVEENIEGMDAFLGVTDDSETNIMSCLMAKSKHVSKIIALIENTDYFELTKSIGVDTLINKKLLTANTIFRYIRKGKVVDLAKLNNMDAEILEFVVSPESKVLGKKIRDLDLSRTATIGGVIRNGEGVIALGDFEIFAGDRVLVCCLPKSISRIERMFR
ncbi:MAG: Trk system potassium transporter TrkA [Flavobacteriaceae bacterium]|jgi:trk system potassium uptake protein TrkA